MSPEVGRRAGRVTNLDLYADRVRHLADEMSAAGMGEPVIWTHDLARRLEGLSLTERQRIARELSRAPVER
ncbi:MAG TPA: hypothetical protein VHN99_05505 [Deinococcales bacterium]|nr:hypothetical protein [Deinococcales bacterium]